ncbi:MAG: CBS domain-containing protein [Methanoregula sp.]|jgi:CBS domain-containing protein|uniref:magnesium transporter MgtE N-terminal domain-containing protein n=1 Tax=Methanoregula sp. TaxID=2052170 RepID=UPI003C193CA3
MVQENSANTSAMAGDLQILLSDILNVPVLRSGKKIGSLLDLVIAETAKIPEVRSLYVSRSFGNPSLLIPWENVHTLTGRGIEVTIGDLKPYETEPTEDVILLRDYVLDKKVIDLEENEVEVVYDIRLVLRNKKLYVTDVDTGKAARLRRLGLGMLAKILYTSADTEAEQMISWKYIQPLPTNIGRFKGDIKLNVLKNKLAEIHPVDLADILEEMDHDQRVMLFSTLEHEHASDTLEEIEPKVQRDIISSLSTDKVVQLINDMTPGQAADVLSVIPHSDAEDILAALNPDNARKLRAIMEKQEEKVIHYTTQKILKFLPDTVVEYVQNDYPRHARGKDVVMYIYVVDGSDRLLGVVDLKELLRADDKAPLSAIMTENVIALNAGSTLKEASQEFERYSFRALPVIDDDNHLIGVIPYRDVMNLTHHFLE